MSLSLLRTLVNSFLECGLAVSIAIDDTLYQTQVFAAPHGDIDIRSPQGHAGNSITTWGDTFSLVFGWV